MLSDLDLAILQLETRHYRRVGAKHAAIRDELGISPTRYFQVLNGLLDSADAAVVAPMVIRRLQRVRDHAAAQRSSRAS